MKVTYLVREKHEDGSVSLEVASREEWVQIRERNKTVPPEEARKFILDCIEDDGDLDMMYIEVSLPEFNKWKSEYKARERNRKQGALFLHLSMDEEITGSEVTSLHECIPDERSNVERVALDDVLFDELRCALRAWKPWAEEMLDLYLAGEKKSSNAFLQEKHGRKERALEYRKEAFEKFVKKFLRFSAPNVVVEG